MAIRARLRSIENRVGAVPCECQSGGGDGRVRVITLEPGQTQPAPEYCPKCGREKKRVVVKFVYEGMMDAL